MERNLDGKWWKYLVFFLFALIIILLVIYHEPWYDESRAWVVAGDTNPVNLCSTYLRYEGHPPLWYFTLMIPAKLGLPLITLNIISALVALFSLYLFLRYSPFPPLIKIIFPFSYFFLYQLTVVARSYVLIPPLLFLIAIIYEEKTEKVYSFVLLLCLLAAVSLHGFVISAALLAVHLVDLIRRRPALSAEIRKKQYIAYGIFGAVTVLLFLILLPPQDLVNPGLNPHITSFFNIARWALAYSMTGYWLWYILIVIYGVSLVWFQRRKVLLLYLLPTLGLLVFFSVSTISGWHLSILFIFWIFTLWISFDRYSGEREYKWKTWLSLKNAVLVCMVFVLGVQIFWSVEAVRTDFKEPYSGSLAVADFIKQNNLEKEKIYYIGELSASPVLAYFDDNIFGNSERDSMRFRSYSSKYQYPENIFTSLNDKSMERIEKDRPDYVIAATAYDPEFESVLPGYELIDIFTGYNFNITSLSKGITDQFLVFKRMDI